MRTKFKAYNVKKDKLKFLFLPVYCGKCLTRFWLEKMMFHWSGNWWFTNGCPLCGGLLWNTKESAISWPSLAHKGECYFLS